MEETPREYKKRIDETREKKRKNRDKFLKYLQEYELVDERFKAKTKQEILANFDKNEKAEKGTELYIQLGQELGSIDLKYQELEDLKKKLESKNHEKKAAVEKIRLYSMSVMDETTLNIKKAEMKILETNMKKISDEIKTIEQEIQNRENEINEIEETYGVKKGSEELVAYEENENTVQTDEEVKNTGTPETLREYRKKRLTELQKINHTRHEIIKLLKEGIGVDEEIKKSIEDEVSKKFFEYYDEKTGTIKMKASKLDGVRSIKFSKKYEQIEKEKEIDGTRIYKVKKDGKRSLLIGNEELGNWYDDICGIVEVGGKPCFKARKDGRYCIMRGNEQYSEWFDYAGEPVEIGGKPAFRATKGRKWCVIRGKEQLGNLFDSIDNLREIGGKPAFFAYDKGKQGVFWGNEIQGDWFDKTQFHYINNIGGRPCFEVLKDGKECIMRGNEQYSIWFDGVSFPNEIGGKPVFTARKGDKYCIIRGTEQMGDWFDQIRYLREIGGKPAFKAKKDGKRYVMRGTEQIGDWFDEIDEINEIGGKPCFRAKKNWKRCVMRGVEQMGDWFDQIRYLREIGGKPAFKAKKDGKRCVIRGNEQIGDLFSSVSNLKKIGGKPCFSAKKDGNYCIMRGTEQMGDWFYTIYGDSPQEIGGKPCFIAKKNGRYCIMRGNELQGGDWFNDIYDDIFKVVGGKPCFGAQKDGKRCVIRGNEQQGDGFDVIDTNSFQEIGGRVCFKARKGNERYIIRGKEQKIIGNKDIIGKIRVVGGKLCYKQKKEGKNYITYCLNRGDGEQSEWFTMIENVIDTGKRPIYIAKKDGKYFIMNGNIQITQGFNNYLISSEDEKSIKVLINEDGGQRVITINKKSNKIEKGNNGQETPQEETKNGQLDTQRGLRESTIISRYEKLLNLKELIKYLKENKIYDKGELEELKGRLTKSFFGNYEKVKESDEFKTAEDEYQKLKEKTREHNLIDKELKKVKLENSEIIDETEQKMLEIANEIMKREGGGLLKKIGMNKLRKERDELEKKRNRIIKLQQEEFKLGMKVKEQLESYGLKIDRRKIKGKSDEELKKWLNLGEITQVKTLKEYKEKHKEIVENSEMIIGFIKSLDLGINNELKDEIIQKIEKFIKSNIKIQEGGDYLKTVNEIENYLDKNLDSIIQKLKGIKKEISKNEEKIAELDGKRMAVEDDELIKINDEIFDIGQQQVKLNNEYEEIKKSINEILYKYDGSDIESRL